MTKEEILQLIDSDLIEVKLIGNDGFDEQEVKDGKDYLKSMIEALPIADVSGSVCQCKVNRMVVRHEHKDWCNSCGELVKAN